MHAEVSVETDVDMRRVIKKLFPYIWCKHKIISFLPPVVTTSPNRITNIAEIMAKSAFVYSCAHKPVIGEYLENSLKRQITTRVKFFRCATFLCLKIRLPEDNIFDYILTICAAVADMALHCRENGFQRALYHSSIFFMAFFESELSNSFHNCGGWTCLLDYISECCFVDLYKRIEPFIAKGYGVVPAIITMKYECIASARRELMMNSRFPTECELESHVPTKLMVDKVLLWDLKEQMQVSDIVPGMFKRMPNIRRVKKSSDSVTLTSHKRHIEDRTAVTRRQYHSSDLGHCPFQRVKGIRRKKTKIINSPRKHPVTPNWNNSERLVEKSSNDLRQNHSEKSDDSFYFKNIRYSLSPSKYPISEFSNLLPRPKMNHPNFHKLQNVCSQPEGNVECQETTSSKPKMNSHSSAENYSNCFILPNSQNMSAFSKKKMAFISKFSKKSISNDVNHLTTNNRQYQNLDTNSEDNTLPGSFSFRKSYNVKMSNSGFMKSTSQYNSGNSNGNVEENHPTTRESLVFVDKSDSSLSNAFQMLTAVLSKGIKEESTNLKEHSDKHVYTKSFCFCNRNHNFNTTELELAVIEHYSRVRYHKLKFQNFKNRCKIESLPPISEADSEEENTHSNTSIDYFDSELYNPIEYPYANGINMRQKVKQDSKNSFNQLHQQHIKEEAKICKLAKSLERMGFTKPTIFKF